MYPSIVISTKAEKSLKNGQLWLEQGDVVGRKPVNPGVVGLLSRKRQFLGNAFCSPRSNYYLRVFSLNNVPIGKEFWRMRICQAFKRRASLEALTNAYRVIYSESDGLSSIVIDKYDDIFALQITSSGAKTIRGDLIDVIKEEFKPASIIEKDDEERVVFGEKTVTEIFEGDQRFIVDVLHGQKTGAYLDYRGFRLKARELARGKCLDAFCYQGWFSCQIARVAESVTGVDASGDAVAAAEKNAVLNGHKNIKFVRADVFEFLKKCDEKFDFIHLDPPSFVRSRADVRSAMMGYSKLLKDALRCLNKGGVILVSSCSHNITENMLEKAVLGSVKGEVIFRGVQDKDHPLLKGFPEALYLKALAVKIA